MATNAAALKKGAAGANSGIHVADYRRREDPRPAYLQSRPTIAGAPIPPTPEELAALAAASPASPPRAGGQQQQAGGAQGAGAAGSGSAAQQPIAAAPMLPATSSATLQLGAFAVSDGRRVLTPSGQPYNHRHKFYYVKESNTAPFATSIVPPAVLPAALLGGVAGAGGGAGPSSPSAGGGGAAARRASAASPSSPQQQAAGQHAADASALFGLPPVGGRSSLSAAAAAAAGPSAALPFRAQTPKLTIAAATAADGRATSPTTASRLLPPGSTAPPPVRPNSASIGMIAPSSAPYAPLTNPHQSVLASGTAYDSVLRPLTSGGIGAGSIGRAGGNDDDDERCGSGRFTSHSFTEVPSSGAEAGGSSPLSATRSGLRSGGGGGRPPRPLSSSAVGSLNSTAVFHHGHASTTSPASSSSAATRSRPPSSAMRIRACGLAMGAIEGNGNGAGNQSTSDDGGWAAPLGPDAASAPTARGVTTDRRPFSAGDGSLIVPNSQQQQRGRRHTVAIIDTSSNAVLAGEDVLDALDSDAGAYAAALLTDFPPIPAETRLRPSRAEVAEYLEAIATWWSEADDATDDAATDGTNGEVASPISPVSSSSPSSQQQQQRRPESPALTELRLLEERGRAGARRRSSAVSSSASASEKQRGIFSGSSSSPNPKQQQRTSLAGVVASRTQSPTATALLSGSGGAFPALSSSEDTAAERLAVRQRLEAVDPNPINGLRPNKRLVSDATRLRIDAKTAEGGGAAAATFGGNNGGALTYTLSTASTSSQQQQQQSGAAATATGVLALLQRRSSVSSAATATSAAAAGAPNVSAALAAAASGHSIATAAVAGPSLLADQLLLERNPYADVADAPLSAVPLAVCGLDVATIFGASEAAERCGDEQQYFEQQRAAAAAAAAARLASEEDDLFPSRKRKKKEREAAKAKAKAAQQQQQAATALEAENTSVGGVDGAVTPMGRKYLASRRGIDDGAPATIDGTSPIPSASAPSPGGCGSPSLSQPTTARPAVGAGGRIATASAAPPPPPPRSRNGIAEVAALIHGALLLKESVEGGGGDGLPTSPAAAAVSRPSTAGGGGVGGGAARPAPTVVSTLTKALTAAHQRLFGHHVWLAEAQQRASLDVATGGGVVGQIQQQQQQKNNNRSNTQPSSPSSSTSSSSSQQQQQQCPYVLKTCVDASAFALQLRVINERGAVVGCHVFAVPLSDHIEASGAPLSVAALATRLSALVGGAAVAAIADEEYMLAMAEYVLATTTGGSVEGESGRIPQTPQNIAAGIVAIPIVASTHSSSQYGSGNSLKNKGSGSVPTRLFTLPQPLQDPSQAAANTRRNHAALCLLSNSVPTTSASTNINSGQQQPKQSQPPSHADFLALVADANLNNGQLVKQLISAAFAVTLDVHLTPDDSSSSSSSSTSAKAPATTTTAIDTFGPIEGTIVTNAGLTVLARLRLSRAAVQRAAAAAPQRASFDRALVAGADGDFLLQNPSAAALERPQSQQGVGTTVPSSPSPLAIPSVVLETTLETAMVRTHAPLVGCSTLSRAALVLAAFAQEAYDDAFAASSSAAAAALSHSSSAGASLFFGGNGGGVGGAPPAFGGSGLTGGTPIDFSAVHGGGADASANGGGGVGIDCIVRSPVPVGGLKTALQTAAAGIAARDEELTEAYLLAHNLTATQNPHASALVGTTASAAAAAAETVATTTPSASLGGTIGRQRGNASSIGTAAKRMSLAAAPSLAATTTAAGNRSATGDSSATAMGIAATAAAGGPNSAGGPHGDSGVSPLLLIAVGQGALPDAVALTSVVASMDAAVTVATPAKRKSVSPGPNKGGASAQQSAAGGKRQSDGGGAAAEGASIGAIAGVQPNVLMAPDGQVVVATVPINVAAYRDQSKNRQLTDAALVRRREELLAAGIISLPTEEPAAPTKPGRRGSRAPSMAASPAKGGGGGASRSNSPAPGHLEMPANGASAARASSLLSPAERALVLSTGASAVAASLYAKKHALLSGGGNGGGGGLATLNGSLVGNAASVSGATAATANPSTESAEAMSFWLPRAATNALQAAALRCSAGARAWEAATVELALPDPMLLPIAIAAVCQDRARRSGGGGAGVGIGYPSQQSNSSNATDRPTTASAATTTRLSRLNAQYGGRGAIGQQQPLMHFALRAEDGPQFAATPFPRPADLFSLASGPLEVFLRARLVPQAGGSSTVSKARQANKAALHQALFATRSAGRALIAYAGVGMKWSSDEAAQFVAAENREARHPNKAVAYAPFAHTSLVSAARAFAANASAPLSSTALAPSATAAASPPHPILSRSEVLFTYGGAYRPHGGDDRSVFAARRAAQQQQQQGHDDSGASYYHRLGSNARNNPTPAFNESSSSSFAAAPSAVRSEAAVFVPPAPDTISPLLTHAAEAAPQRHTRATVALQVRATAPSMSAALVNGTATASMLGGAQSVTPSMLDAQLLSYRAAGAIAASSAGGSRVGSAGGGHNASTTSAVAVGSTSRGGRVVRATFVAHPCERVADFAAEVEEMAKELVAIIMY